MELNLELLIGSITIVVSFSLILVFQFTASMVMLNLTILGAGMSITNASAVVQWNSLRSSNAAQFTGMATGPVIAGVYMQTHKILLNSNTTSGSSFPSPKANNLIFLTGGIIVSTIYCLFKAVEKKSGTIWKSNGKQLKLFYLVRYRVI